MSGDELWKELRQCGSEGELVEVLRRVKHASDEVSVELDEVVAGGRAAQNHSLKRLESLRGQLATALGSSRELGSSLAGASFVALRISSKVRSIDNEHSRVKQALKYVQDIQLLKSSILGIRDAMDTRDWERAANYASKARQLPKELINGQFAKLMIPTSEVPNYPQESLTEACDSLCQLFLREFDKATKIRDMDNVSRYFRLFPLIGEETQGLDVYGKFVCGIITTQSRQLIQSRPSDGSMIYGFAMSRLFENIASIVEKHTPIVEKHYGTGRMARVVDSIQNVADSQGGLIIDTFWDEQRINKVVSEVKSYAYSYLVSSFTSSGRMAGAARSGSPSLDAQYQPRRSEDEGVDLKQVAGFVNEMSVMLNRWNLYCNFLAVRWDSFSLIDQAPASVSASASASVSASASTTASTPASASTPTATPTPSRSSTHIITPGSLIPGTSHNGSINTIPGSSSSSSGTVIPVSDEQTTTSSTLHVPSVIVSSQLKKKVDTIVNPAMESLAVFVFRRSVEKAFQLEDLPDLTQKFTPEIPVVTSVVDDVMYILNTLTQQVLSTGQTDFIKTVISSFRRILESDFVGIIQRKLRDEAPKQQLATSTPARVATPLARKPTANMSMSTSSANPSTSSGLGNPALGSSTTVAPSFGIPIMEERKLRIFLIYLNTLSVTADYTNRILRSMDVEGQLHFDDDAQLVTDTLESLSTNFRARCNDLINDGVQVVFTTVINPRLRTICSAMFRDADYMLSPEETDTEDDYTSSSHRSSSRNHSISANFAYDWNSLMAGYAHTLSPDNYNKLIALVATSLSRTIEKWIWSLEGKVNELGAIRLDRDISKIIGILTDGRYKVRDKFVRVAQIVTIVGFDDIDDEQDDIDWILSDSDRQRARQIRVDR
ncbi:Cog4p [Sugiyamaella lignohabitans]|uniref:Conserved oligomeric Golgi complex subunit 4 n=1 Tax=Sugiyamaella lignohabitans TaxID=796027 RepID=A0A167D346_9ASCO|nr:Cog4p [Sugiyamaella lignohabitans]ANB12421.1 Cog4p [Sugiyamaella lignohabitans]